MARSVDTTDGTDPTEDSVEVDSSDDAEFADGFEVFDPDVDDDDLDEAADDDAEVLIEDADGESDDIDVGVALDLDASAFADDESLAETTIDPDGSDDDEVEGVRGTEFVCTGCYLAKRHTQLADKKRSLCIDCV